MYPRGIWCSMRPHVREGEIQAVAFDVERLATRGQPVTVLEEVFRSPGSGVANFAVAQNGALVYVLGGYARTLVRVDRNGRRTPLLNERRGFRLPRVSPDAPAWRSRSIRGRRRSGCTTSCGSPAFPW